MKGFGTVKQITSGDTLVVMGVPKGGAPPERTLTIAGIFAPRIAIHTQSHDSPDEPYGFEAREFLRKMLTGNVVQFTIESEDRGRQFAVCLYDGNDIALALLRAGLAKVRGLKPGTSPAAYLDDYRSAEAGAKDAKLGIWGGESAKAATVRSIAYIFGDAEATKQFAESHRGTKLTAIIEYIRDGCSYRVYFPELKTYAGLLLSGIQCDTFKRVDGSSDLVPEPFAAEAKYFCEVRVLNRDVNVRIEGADDYGNIIGSISGARDDMAVLLLQNGFARLVEWSLRLTEKSEALRAALAEAQEKRIRRWKDWECPLAGLDKEYWAKVIEAVSGDCLMVLPVVDMKGTKVTDVGQLVTERRVFLASLKCPRAATKTRPADPWAVDAKEFVRKRLVGKVVQIQLEYMRKPVPSPTGVMPPVSDAEGRMHFVSILYDNGKTNISQQLVSMGLAELLKHRGEDPRVSNYAELEAFQSEAQAKKIGIHGQTAPKHPLNDLVGPENKSRANAFLASLKRCDQVEAIVEHVFSGHRFKIRIPTEHLAISFTLGGIESVTPQLASRKGPEAMDLCEDAISFARETLLQRNVLVKIDHLDRGGNFIGTMWHNKSCINIEVVKLGLARVFDPATRIQKSELVDAEAEAQANQLGIWASGKIFDSDAYSPNGDLSESPVSLQPSSVTSTSTATRVWPCVRIVSGGTVNEFFITEEPSKMASQIEEKISQLSQSVLQSKSSLYSESMLPRKDAVILCRCPATSKFYRGQVLSVAKQCNPKNGQGAFVTCCLLDRGKVVSMPLDACRRCPQDLSALPSQATRCALSGVKKVKGMDSDCDQEFRNLTDNRTMRCLVEKVEGNPKTAFVILIPLEGGENTQPLETDGKPTEEADLSSINELLVEGGWVIFNKKSRTSLAEPLKVAEKKARSQRANVWQFGDVGDSDDGN